MGYIILQILCMYRTCQYTYTFYYIHILDASLCYRTGIWSRWEISHTAYKAYHRYTKVMSRIRMFHIMHRNESCHTYEWGHCSRWDTTTHMRTIVRWVIRHNQMSSNWHCHHQWVVTLLTYITYKRVMIKLTVESRVVTSQCWPYRYAYIHSYTYIHTCTPACVCARARVHACVCLCECACGTVWRCVRVCLRAVQPVLVCARIPPQRTDSFGSQWDDF